MKYFHRTVRSLLGLIVFLLVFIFCATPAQTAQKKNKMSMLDLNIGYISDKYDMNDLYFGIGLFNNTHRMPFGLGYFYDTAIERDNLKENWSQYHRSLVREMHTHHFQIRYPLFFRGKFPYDKFHALFTSGNIIYGTGTAGKGNFMYSYLFGSYLKSTYSQTYEYRLRYDDTKFREKTETTEGNYRFGLKWDGQYRFMHSWVSPFYDFVKGSSYFGYEIGAGLNYGRARLSFVYRSINKHIWTGGQFGGHWGF